MVRYDGVTVLRWRVKLQKIHRKLVKHLLIRHMHLFLESSVTDSFYALFNPISSQTVNKCQLLMNLHDSISWIVFIFSSFSFLNCFDFCSFSFSI